MKSITLSQRSVRPVAGRLRVLLEVFQHLLFLPRIALSFLENGTVLFFIGHLQIIGAADFSQHRAKTHTAAGKHISLGLVIIGHAFIRRMVIVVVVMIVVMVMVVVMLLRVHRLTDAVVFLCNK